jgi:hypothetical protein
MDTRMRLRICAALAASALFLLGTSACQSESAPDDDLDSLVNPGGNGVGASGAPGGVLGDSPDTALSDTTDGGTNDATPDDGSAAGADAIIDPVRQARIVQMLREAENACESWCDLRVVCIATVDLPACIAGCSSTADAIDAQLDESANAVRCAESVRDTFRCTGNFTCEDVYNVQQGFSHSCSALFDATTIACRAFGVTTLDLFHLD